MPQISCQVTPFPPVHHRKGTLIVEDRARHIPFVSGDYTLFPEVLPTNVLVSASWAVVRAARLNAATAAKGQRLHG